MGEVHLNQLDPLNIPEQLNAFKAATLSVASLLHHKFDDPKYQRSRELDPRVQVSFTGLFDFFVTAFGVDWLKWWEAGRPDYYPLPGFTTSDHIMFGQFDIPIEEYQIVTGDEYNFGELYKELERCYLSLWKEQVNTTLTEYCEKHNLRKPNRYTGVQPAGTKSLLTGASPGWHPPKAQRYIRRITFKREHPVALACIDFGYSVVPSQSCKDEDGNLLNDPYDPRVDEWLIEIPVEVPWANLPGADQIIIENFSVLAQFDFYMQVQTYYTTCNTSATIELREDEINDLATAIYKTIQTDGGYISAALQARFDAPFPRLPFEKIDKENYDQLSQAVTDRRKPGTFHDHLMRHDKGWGQDEGASGCDSDKCLFPLAEPSKAVTEGDIFKPV